MAIGGLHREPDESSVATVEWQHPRERTAEDLHELLTVEDVAALLKVSRSWVYEHTRSRGTPRTERLPHIKIGKYLRFEARTVRAFLEKKSRLA